jgi:hypothetical protein
MFAGNLSNVLIVENDCGEVYFIEDKNKKTKLKKTKAKSEAIRKRIEIRESQESDDDEIGLPIK